ncbi:hypothetical protein BC833DRAFT_43542 [Globomyces pollinis-pini]|nr:hypothetical protein BC833DRAFT_43542 [Globomyces pollinis-pini]
MKRKAEPQSKQTHIKKSKEDFNHHNIKHSINQNETVCKPNLNEDSIQENEQNDNCIQEHEQKVDTIQESEQKEDSIENKQIHHLIILPGAMGKITKDFHSLLTKLESTYNIIKREKLTWNTRSTKSTSNFDLVKDMIKETNGQPYTIIANSFGNRIVLEMLGHHLIDPLPQSIIMCGYPLYGPKNTNDRIEHFDSIQNSKIPFCFISGNQDEFLTRSFMKTKGFDALKSIVNCLNLETVTYHCVDKGAHSIPTIKGSKNVQMHVINELVDLIKSQTKLQTKPI